MFLEYTVVSGIEEIDHLPDVFDTVLLQYDIGFRSFLYQMSEFIYQCHILEWIHTEVTTTQSLKVLRLGAYNCSVYSKTLARAILVLADDGKVGVLLTPQKLAKGRGD